ncbi:MAG: acetolactate synthase small subunit [Ruminococcus sp.]|nr:acetolactate synthase small subunit [Ruminococcus sp.]
MQNNQYVIGAIVSNISGVLSRVSGMFTRRGFNIDCLTVGETESAEFSRITVVFHGDDDIRERIVKQLEKLHDVKEVEVLDPHETVIRELLLIKVRNTPSTRQDIMTAVEIFRSKIVDYSPTALVCELTGETSKINAFIDLMKPYGIMEMCRTGIVAIERGDNCLTTER